MKKHIPNLITLLNLAAGSLSLYLVLAEQINAALALLLAAAFFDFMDGTMARILKAYSELGKQLDSLADLVSFGLVPAAMIFMVFKSLLEVEFSTWYFLVLLVPMAAALRLGKFNLQEDLRFFQGMPTPAFALFWVGLYYDFMTNGTFYGQELNSWFLGMLILLFSAFMLLPLSMLSLKFSSFGWKENKLRYLLLGISVIILVFTGLPGLSMVILAYILLSLVNIVLT